MSGPVPAPGARRPRSGDGQVPVAIVGMGVLLPGAPDLPAYWTNLLEGRDAITDVPPQRWDPRFYTPHGSAAPRADRIYCRRGGFVDDLAVADPLRFGIGLVEAEAVEPEQLLALRVAAAAVEDAGGVASLGDLSRVGVVLGRSGYMSCGLVRLDQRVRTARQLVHTLGNLLPRATPEDLERVREAFTDALGPEPGEAALSLVPGLSASRISTWLGLRGPAYTVDAACASSLLAVDAAVAELASGRCDAVLAGGAHHCHDVTLWSLFCQLGALSPRQRILPFDAEADGTLIGEGTGVVVLKRLDDALAAGDRVYAAVRGSGVSGGGLGAGGLAPDPDGAALAMRRAWAAAGLDPRDPDAVGLVEAHGAGIAATDEAELAALAEVFGPPTSRRVAVLGSVKSMIGHAMSAAGIAGLVKAALAVHRAVLLPTLNCDRPHPALGRTRFTPLVAACPWECSGPRRAAVSALGLGGTNAHVVLEQVPDTTRASAPAPARRAASVREPGQVLRFAAPTPEALSEMLDADDAVLRERGADVPAYTGPGSRLGLVDPTERRLSVARRVARGARGGGWAAWRGRNDVWLSSEPLLAEPSSRIAFVFPGLEAEFAPRIDDVAEQLGLPMPDLSTDGVGRHGSSVLRIGRVLERALDRMGVRPQALAGHSVGEWSAMFASGMVDEEGVDEAVFGPVMDDLAAVDVDYASMACPIETAGEAIAPYPDVTLSHDNAPNQTVVCGPPASIRALAREQRSRNILVRILPFRSGFHTPALAPYLDEIARRMEAVPIRRGPRTELWSATLAGRYPDSPEEIRALALRHLLEPVRFRPMTLAMYEAGVRVFIQVGQGRLGGLVDDTLDYLPHLTVAANSSRRSGLDQLLRVAVALWVEGGTPRFDVLRPPHTLTGAQDRTSGPAVPGNRTADREVDEEAAPTVRVNLGTELVTLDPGVLARPEAEAIPGTAGLTGWARRDPVAGELLDLLTDTARTAVAALEGAAGDCPLEPLTTRLRVDVQAMPFLLDHCIAPQRSGWPEISDRRPVMPATTILRLMGDIAQKAAPGRIAVGFSEVRFDRWLPAEPPTDVAVSVHPTGRDSVTVSFGDSARAVVRLAGSYPAQNRPRWPHEGSLEEPPVLGASELYSERWLFHGPRFHGVIALAGHGERHVRAVLTPTTAPGSLLDAAGQLLAYYARVNLPDRNVLFPAGIDRIDLYGPEPAPGTPVDCLGWVPWYDRDWLQAHFQLVVDGRVWAEVTGWLDRRFDIRPETDDAFRFPERHTLARPMPGGWVLAAEAWDDLASRDLYVSRYLGAAERDELQGLPPRERRGRLLGRIALKDAVRTLLWTTGPPSPIYPAELRVRKASDGAPRVTGEHGLDLPVTRVSLARGGEVAVAVADGEAPGGAPGVGIDVEAVAEHPREVVDAALTPDEQDLLRHLARRDGPGDAGWLARFRTAKQAAAKSFGTGLDDVRGRFTVTPDGAAADRLVVAGPSGRTVEVLLAEVSNPPHLPPRDYVVARTLTTSDQTRPGGTTS
jgi:acyl transferase domain-containing protein